MPSLEAKKTLQTQGPDDTAVSDVNDSSHKVRIPFEGNFEYKFKCFSLLMQRISTSSEIFEFGPFKWKLILFPKGNDGEQGLSIYLDVADADRLQPGWRRDVNFSFTLVNIDEAKNKTMFGTHVFWIEERDRGFANIIRPNCAIYMEESEGFCVNDTLTFRVSFTIEKVWNADPSDGHFSLSDTMDCDTKSETGFVGLQNQGATCYLNSFFQSLFHLPYFRSAVYSIQADSGRSPIPYALQNLFWELENSDNSAYTSELTKSFGWKSEQLLMQHDIQEFARILDENLENRMKGTSVEGTIEKLFQGQMQSCIKCAETDFQSSKDEVFYDLSLNVHKHLYDSIDKFTEIEKLEGSNRWKPNDTLGLQIAEKWIKFKTLPPVLRLHLKRFSYDWNLRCYVKDNSEMNFPCELNLTKYMASTDSDQPESVYSLYGVLVHSGRMNSGHYHAFLRPFIKSQWYCFDDSLVKKVDEFQAVTDNFGGEEIRYIKWQDGRSVPITSEKSRSAYMLIYVRKSDQDWIFDSKNKADSKFLENMQMRSRMDVKVFTDTDFNENAGIGLATIDHSKQFKLKKDTLLSQLVCEIEKTMNRSQRIQRIWEMKLCDDRERVLLKKPFSDSELDTKIGSLDVNYSFLDFTDLMLYAESNMSFEHQTMIDEELADAKTNNLNYILVFFKILTSKGLSANVKKLYLKNASRSDILVKAEKIVKSICAYSSSHIVVWRETSGGLERVLKQDPTPVKSGSLFLIEQDTLESGIAPLSIPHLYHMTEVIFKPRDHPLSDYVTLYLPVHALYNDIIKKLSNALGCSKHELRIYHEDCSLGILQPSNNKIGLSAGSFFFYKKLTASPEPLPERQMCFFWRPERQINHHGPYYLFMRPEADVNEFFEAIENDPITKGLPVSVDTCLLSKLGNDLSVCPRNTPISSIDGSAELIIEKSLRQVSNTEIVVVQFVKSDASFHEIVNIGLPLFFELFECEDVSSIIKRASETYAIPESLELSGISLFSSVSPFGPNDKLALRELDKSSFPLLFHLTDKKGLASSPNTRPLKSDADLCVDN